MKVVLGIVCAFLLHAAFLLFGRLLFPDLEEETGTLQQVELLSEAEAEKEKEAEPKEPVPESEAKEMETEEEAPPDANEILRNLELTAVNDAPALEAASLSAIEAALMGQGGGGGDFGQSLDFASGGRIGGTGKASMLEESLENAFSMAEIDQKPRAVFQGAPLYPAELRSKKVEGVVTVVFIVGSDGKVESPRVEKSTHTSFDKPALEAVKKWKFEPAIRSGQRVPCKMRVPIRFQPS